MRLHALGPGNPLREAGRQQKPVIDSVAQIKKKQYEAEKVTCSNVTQAENCLAEFISYVFYKHYYLLLQVLIATT